MCGRRSISRCSRARTPSRNGRRAPGSSRCSTRSRSPSARASSPPTPRSPRARIRATRTAAPSFPSAASSSSPARSDARGRRVAALAGLSRSSPQRRRRAVRGAAAPGALLSRPARQRRERAVPAAGRRRVASHLHRGGRGVLAHRGRARQPRWRPPPLHPHGPRRRARAGRATASRRLHGGAPPRRRAAPRLRGRSPRERPPPRRALPSRGGGVTPLVRRYIKTSFAFLVLGLALGAYLIVTQFGVGAYPPRLVVTAHVHLLLVGFMLMIVMGVATWMFPRPSREDTRYRPELAEAVYWMMTLATAARAAAEIAGPYVGVPALRWVITLGGIGQLAAAAVFVVNMWSRVRMPAVAPPTR